MENKKYIKIVIVPRKESVETLFLETSTLSEEEQKHILNLDDGNFEAKSVSEFLDDIGFFDSDFGLREHKYKKLVTKKACCADIKKFGNEINLSGGCPSIVLYNDIV